MKGYALAIFACALIVMGLTLAFVSFNRLRSGKASLNWPGTSGKIVSSRVASTEQIGEKQRKYITYHAEVSYAYNVGGREYVASQPMVDQPVKTYAADAQALVDEFPTGKSVTVYFNPANPQESVLKTGARVNSYVAFVFGVVLSVIGLILFSSKVLAKMK